MAEPNEEGRENKYKEENLFLFFSGSDSLENALTNYKMLKSLIVIGQEVGTLEGIEELKHLEELWVVESNLQQENVDPVSKCCGLKRLYLYDNELTAIPQLESLSKLSHLWLSDNKIDSFQNINSLSNLKELYLSNNNITEIDIKLKATLKIVFMNLSGNPITNLKEIRKLDTLRKLRWLVLSDPLFRITPVSLLANFRALVIYCLPGLEKLDMHHISSTERKQTMIFAGQVTCIEYVFEPERRYFQYLKEIVRAVFEMLFDTKLEYYRLYLHNTLAKLHDSQKALMELENKALEVIWTTLSNHGPHQEKDEKDKDNNLRFWEGEARRWKERRKLHQQKYEKLEEVLTQKVNLEVESCGNLQFLEMDLTENGGQDQFKKCLNTFLCLHLKKNVLELNLQNVWSIQGPYPTIVLQSQFQDSMNNVYIVSPSEDLGIQPFKLVENILFGNKLDKELCLTNCLAHADPLVSNGATLHRQLLLRSQALLSSRLLLICGITDPSQLIESGLSHNVMGLTSQLPDPSHSPGCVQWCLSNSSVLVPLYLVHFLYVFQDYFKPLKVSQVETRGDQLLTPQPANTKHISQHITVLELKAANLHSLDFPVMEQVTTVDLSYNYLQDISSVGNIFPKMAKLNVAFNRINALNNLQTMKHVTQITLAWNFLSDFLSTLKSLKEASCLKQVDLSYNPFKDVISTLHQYYFVCKHLSGLHSFNGHPLQRSLIANQVNLEGQELFPMVPMSKYYQQPLTLRWNSALSNVDSQNHLGVHNDQIVSITLRGLKLNQFRSIFSLAKLKWLDLSNNLYSGPSSLKVFTALEEVNLSHNVIDSFYIPNERFKYLTKLNLSHNYISSLASFSCQALPKVKLLDLSNNRLHSLTGLSGLKTVTELYVSHNFIHDLNTLVHCKEMKELRVLDISYNPLVQNDSFRRTCLYHMNWLKYINGCKVRASEVKSAVTLYEGLLDQEYLSQTFKGVPITNLTQLSLSNCSIKKVCLPMLTLPNIVSVILDHNKISCLSWMHSFPNVSKLSLSHNLVSAYSDGSLPSYHTSSIPPLPSLRSLILDHNRIRNLPLLKLDLFPSLHVLVINNNEISSLSGLKYNSQLKHLMLDRNKLMSISCDQIQHLENLVVLYIEHNSLSKLDFLRPLKKLQKLFVGYNKLVAKTCLIPLTGLPELRELTVHGNPLFRSSKSYRDCLPHLPTLQLLEGHSVNISK